MDAHSDTLRRALEALDSICTRPTPKPSMPTPKRVAQQPNVQPESSHNPAAWREPVAGWLNATCVRHRRCFSGVTSLHRAYCDWEVSNGDAPCPREIFEQLLRESGLLIVNELVSGLILRADLDGLLVYPKVSRLLY
jgi:hypothetical protein